MRYFLLLTLTFLTWSLQSQVGAPGTGFILKSGEVYWEHAYKTTAKLPELMSAITAAAGSNPQIEIAQSTQNRIVLRVQNDKPDLKKSGVKPSRAASFTKLYMKYQAVIEVKDHQYTVHISEIFLDNKDRTNRTSGDISSFVCNTSNLTFKTDRPTQEGMAILDLHFKKKFNFSQ